jgi:hypothetical protein
MRGPLAKVRDEAFLAIRFSTKLKNLLLPEEVHGKSRRDKIGEAIIGRRIKILGVVVENEGVANLEKLDELAMNLGIGARFAVVKVIHGAFEKGILLIEFDDTERSAANGEDVHASVLVALGEFQDFRRATDVGDTFRKGEEHAELGLVLQAGVDHGTVTRLENVQR